MSPWVTVYSMKGYATAKRIAFLCLPILIAWGLFALFVAPTGFRFFTIIVVAALVGFVLWRHANTRVELHPQGVSIVNTWKTHNIAWYAISDVNVALRNVTFHDEFGGVEPIPEVWDMLLEEEPSLVLFDMWEGPQQIAELWVTLHDGTLLFIDANDRYTMKALADAHLHVLNNSENYY